MYKVMVTESAHMDIRESVRYIAEELQNPIAAGRLLNDAYNAIDSLEEMPQRHALVKNELLARLGFLFIPVRKYLIFYIVREDTRSVTVERFLHGRRNWMNIIGEQYLLSSKTLHLDKDVLA